MHSRLTQMRECICGRPPSSESGSGSSVSVFEAWPRSLTSSSTATRPSVPNGAMARWTVARLTLSSAAMVC